MSSASTLIQPKNTIIDTSIHVLSGKSFTNLSLYFFLGNYIVPSLQRFLYLELMI